MDSTYCCHLGYIFADSPAGQTAPTTNTTLTTRLSAPAFFPKQATDLPYLPYLPPSTRDVARPYGAIRVYDWDLKYGEKVLFIRGDTTPAPVLGPVARDL